MGTHFSFIFMYKNKTQCRLNALDSSPVCNHTQNAIISSNTIHSDGPGTTKDEQ